MSQTERILYIDRVLRSKGRITTAETATHFEVSTRQIKRDIEYLRDRFNAPLVYDAKIRAYCYDRAFRDLQFADQKMVLFYVILKSLSENEHYIPVYSEEIISNFEQLVASDYLPVCNKISFQIPQTDLLDPEYFMTVCDALRDRSCLQIIYLNVKGSMSERIIEPEHIINYGGNWYMICWDRLKSSLRTFHFSRIMSMQLTGTPFTDHTTDWHSEEFSSYDEELHSYISGSFGIFKGKTLALARIRFYGPAIHIVKTQIWHPSQSVIEDREKDGTSYLEMSVPVANYTEILSRILAFGSQARPLEPPELCHLWKKEIKAMGRIV
jgi:predicted DNA-binding transcriptional regulator YafY